MAAQATMETEYIITFTSSHLALKAEALLKNSGMVTRLITAPRAISSQCGFCLLLQCGEETNLAVQLQHLLLNYSQIYIRQQLDGVTYYEQKN